MKAPQFWTNPPDAAGLKSRLLAPLGWVYALATRRRLRAKGYRASVPVICVGNINAGGTGKTPTVIALLQILSTKGITAHVVSRGYGGSLAGPVRVIESQHTANQVGDEPLLMSAFGTVWVSQDRAEGVRAAEAEGAQVILLDDGFQNPSVEKSASIVVVDAAVGFGNGRCIPAGPLRETVAAGLGRATAVLVIGTPESRSRFRDTWATALRTVTVFEAQIQPLQTGMHWPGLRVLAFAGLGRPEKFFETLRTTGAHVERTQALDDHQPLTPALFARLEREAAAIHAQLVTTEKDAVRLPASQRHKVLTLPVRLEIEDVAGLLETLGLKPAS